MTTSFCSAVVPLFDGLSFHIDGNSKITLDNGTYTNPKPNAFSLPHIATCPGSTERCRASCYVHGLKKHAPEVYRTYELNEMALHQVLMHPRSLHNSAAILATWIYEHAPYGFRWHVSGDVFSHRHAEWIAQVCRFARGARDVPFWIYTRSLDFVSALKKAENLTVNVSADMHNYKDAARVAALYSARLVYLVSDPNEKIPDGVEVIFPDYPLRGRDLAEPTSAPWWQGLTQERRRLVCPADFFEQSEAHRCGPCRKCLDIL